MPQLQAVVPLKVQFSNFLALNMLFLALNMLFLACLLCDSHPSYVSDMNPFLSVFYSLRVTGLFTVTESVLQRKCSMYENIRDLITISERACGYSTKTLLHFWWLDLLSSFGDEVPHKERWVFVRSVFIHCTQPFPMKEKYRGRRLAYISPASPFSMSFFISNHLRGQRGTRLQDADLPCTERRWTVGPSITLRCITSSNM